MISQPIAVVCIAYPSDEKSLEYSYRNRILLKVHPEVKSLPITDLHLVDSEMVFFLFPSRSASPAHLQYQEEWQVML